MNSSNTRRKLVITFLTAFSLLIPVIVTKLSNLSIRLSDTNVYFVIASRILEGSVLYRDIFHTNLPLMPYIHSLYLVLTGFNPLAFYATPLLEITGTLIILTLLFMRMRLPLLMICGSLIAYLYSFIVLATSDHQTGIHTAVFFAVLAYYLYTGKRYIFAGVAIALMVATKGYFLPIGFAFVLHHIITHKQRAVPFIATAAATGLLTLLPSFILAGPEFFSQIFGYSAVRSENIDRWTVFQTFLMLDWFIMVMAIVSVFLARRILLVTLSIGAGVAYLTLYPDIYYFYFMMLVPFGVIAFVELYLWSEQKLNREAAITLGLVLIVFVTILNGNNYLRFMPEYNKVLSYSALEQVILDHSPDVLYGMADITPMLSYTTGVPLMDGIIDTNFKMFSMGVYDSQEKTDRIFEQNTMIITYGVAQELRIDGQIVNGDNTMYYGLFDPVTIEVSCPIVYSHPIVFEPPLNRIHIRKCTSGERVDGDTVE